MDDNLIRIKYKYLQSNLYNIKSELDELYVIMEDLKGDLKSSIIIDDKYAEEDNFEVCLECQKDVYNELSTKIIPIVSNRC